MIALRSPHDGFEFGALRVDARGPRKGAIVVIQEIFGISDHIRERCDVFADAGYDAIAPSVFDRIERGFQAPFELDGIMKGRAAVDATPWDQLAADVQAAIDAVAPPVFVTGFCYGGAVAWLAAARCTGLTAASAFYGRLINQLLDDVPAIPTVLHYGAHDPSITPDMVHEVRRRYPDLTVHLYDAGHGFCRQGSGDYDEPSCVLATERTLAWFAARSALTCRTALAPGERCDAGARHRVVQLGEPKERALALDAVWGPPHLRAKRFAKVTGGGGAAGGLFEGCGGCDGCGGADFGGELGAILVVIVVAAIAAIAIWWITTRIIHAVRNHRARLRPQGAEKLPRPRDGVVAVVASGEAWGLQLQHDDALGTKVTLRDGEATGVKLTLDDGRTIVVPDGRARVDGEGEKIDGVDHARRLDPWYREADDHPVLPWDRALEVRIAPGDRVQLFGALETRPDPRAGEVGYRDAAPSILVPAGVAWLRRL